MNERKQLKKLLELPPIPKKRGRPRKTPAPIVAPEPEKKRSNAGRKSILRPYQWDEIKRKHIVDGVSFRKLAEEYGISATAIKEQISDQAKEIISTAIELSNAEKKLMGLPISAQGLANTVLSNLRAATVNMAEGMASHASTFRRTAKLANMRTERLDETKSFAENEPVLREIAVLTEISNNAAKVPLAMMAANKDLREVPQDDEEPMKTIDPISASKAYTALLGN